MGRPKQRRRRQTRQRPRRQYHRHQPGRRLHRQYTTKDATITGSGLRRLTDLTVELLADPHTHDGRLIRAAWNLGATDGWQRLRRYAHQYGYGGHITTKSRAFSVTYGFLRMQRTIWRRTQGHPHTWDDEQAALVIYELGYHATGWITTGDALLARTAAAQARERHQAGLDALTDPPATTNSGPAIAA